VFVASARPGLLNRERVDRALDSISVLLGSSNPIRESDHG